MTRDDAEGPSTTPIKLPDKLRSEACPAILHDEFLAPSELYQLNIYLGQLQLHCHPAMPQDVILVGTECGVP